MKSLAKNIWRRNLYKWGLVAIALTATAGLLLDAADGNKAYAAATAPAPDQHHDAIVQVYAARTLGKKGKLAVHTWIVSKRSGANRYMRYEVMGWQLRYSGSAMRVRNWYGNTSWWGNPGTLLLERRGAGVDQIIDKIEKAIENYPYQSEYRLWPGPNSNTFTAYVGLAVPELRLDLPSTAIGKDYRPIGRAVGRSPSGTGVQFSLFGLLSVTLGLEEGVELSFLGANFEWDALDLAVEIPVIGRIGRHVGADIPQQRLRLASSCTGLELAPPCADILATDPLPVDG